MNYLYSSDRELALRRLRALERVEDPNTFDLLDNLEVSAGWHCLEVGAGAGSVAKWLSGRVGPTGRVVATDIDTELLNELSVSGVSVRCHDLTADELPQASFDLVHARHVLIHMSGVVTDHALTLARALKPGGLLLLEESDLTTSSAGDSVGDDRRGRYESVMGKIHRLYEDRGMDLRLGARLPSVMRNAGLVDIQSSRTCRFVNGADGEAHFHKMTFALLREPLVSRYAVSHTDFDFFLGLHDDPAFSYRTRTTVSTRGRRCGSK